MTRLVVLLLTAVLLVTASAAAQTPDVERSKEFFRAAAAAYAAGKYDVAIQALEEAYRLAPLPAIAFSWAQAERRQYFVSRERRHLDRAVELFRRYLVEVTEGGRRADAIEALSQLEPLLALEQQQAEPAAPAEPARPDAPTRLMITADVPSAMVVVDSGEPSSSPAIVDVAPGSHQIRVSAPGYHPVAREVMALSGALVPVEISLPALPAELLVTGPSDADLYVDGSLLGKLGSGRLLSLRAGKHRVMATKKGHRVEVKELKLERGQAYRVRLTLQPTVQRRASTVLFIAGAAALSTGVMLTALAVQYENDAEAVLGSRQVRNISERELSRYNAALTSRNRMRIAATATLASSVGLGITGLFLRELDRPDPAAALRGREIELSRPASFTLGPLLDGVGGAIHGTF